MTRDELEAVRNRAHLYDDPHAIVSCAKDRRDILVLVDRLLAVVAAADAWLAKDDAVEDDPLTVKSREAYRAARKTLETP